MKTIYTDTRLIADTVPAFFAGANTGEGFRGTYHTFADEGEMERVWIIKGGSGTGKSTLMRKIAADAAEDGHMCTFYRCSSDPDSLDAVVIDGRFVILDGTAPHVWEMQYPGAASEIIYVGKYWKADRLAAEKDTIAGLCRMKNEAYGKGYHTLHALSALEKDQFDSAMSLLDQSKLEGFIRRLLRSVPKGDRAGGEFPCRTWSVGMKGLARTGGLYALSETTMVLEDLYASAPCFLALLAEACRRERIPFRFSEHPVNDRITEITILPLSLTVALAPGENPPDKTICMRRFVRKELPEGLRGQIRLRSRLMCELLEEACTHLAEAGEAHGKLEEIYRSAMDFAAMNRDTAVTRRRIRAALNE